MYAISTVTAGGTLTLLTPSTLHNPMAHVDELIVADIPAEGPKTGLLARVIRYVRGRLNGQKSEDSHTSDSPKKDKVITEETDLSRMIEVFDKEIINEIYGFFEKYFFLTRKATPEEVVFHIAADRENFFSSQEACYAFFGKNPRLGRDLLRLAVRNYLNESGLRFMPEKTLDILVEDLYFQLSQGDFDEMETLKELLFANAAFSDYRTTVVAQVKERAIYLTVSPLREEALQEMGKRNFDFSEWTAIGSNPLALTDEMMGDLFFRKDQKVSDPDDLGSLFLTTYFDTAQFGLGSHFIHERARLAAKTKHDFDDFRREYKLSILRALGLTHKQAQLNYSRTTESGVPQNLIFTECGGEAGKLFIQRCVRKGDTVIVTDQEYGDFVMCLATESVGANIITLPPFADRESYTAQLHEILGERSVQWILASDVSRFGTKMPLELFSKIRAHYPSVRLAVDACQAAGRKDLKYDLIDPDAVILSWHKGADISGNVGALVMKDEIFDEFFLKDLILNADNFGTREPLFAVNARLACAPQKLGTPNLKDVPAEDARKLTASVKQREVAIANLSLKFALLIQQINERCKDRVIMINPKFVYSGKKINRDCLSFVFELKIAGITREQVRHVAQQYGVTINHFYGETEKGISFRIALHPYSNDEALKILGYVLLRCCQQYPG